MDFHDIERLQHSGSWDAAGGLLGTRFTMEQAFYRDRLRERHGIAVLVPEQEDRDTVHRIIYDELCRGVIAPASRSAYRRIMAGCVQSVSPAEADGY